MQRTAFLKRNILYIFPVFLLILPTLFLFQESVGRASVLLLSFLLWIVFLCLTKKGINASLLYILFVLPFNITYQLPYSTNLFDPFVNGIFVNYLNPTFSILDIGMFLLLFSIFKEVKITFLRNIFNKFKWYIIVLLLFLVLQNIYLWDLLIFLNTVRIFSITMLLIMLPSILSLPKVREIEIPLALILIVNTLFQGILGIIQFSRGSSLGIKFLGESQVVSGMQGSSFLELFDGIYLRAYGTFPHPNILGGFFLVIFFLCIYFFFKNGRKLKFVYLLTAFFSVIFSVFTFSRVILLLFLLNIFILCFVYILKKKKHFFSFSPILLVERFQNLLVGGDTSWEDRINLLKASFNVFKQNWLLGTGFGNFVKAMGDNVPRTGNGIQLLQPVHNVFVLLLTDLGVFGFLSFLLLIVKVLRVYVKKINIFTVLLLFSLGIIGIFDHYLVSLPQGLVLLGIFLVLSLLSSEGLKKDEYNVHKN